MPFVKISEVDVSKISLGDIFTSQKPVPYQSVPIKYMYDSSKKPGNLIIRTPLVNTTGIFENKDKATDNLTGYSLPITIENTNEKNKEGIECFETLIKVIERIRELLYKIENKIRNNKKKSVNIDGLNIIKYRDDGTPVVYPKLWTDKDLTITTGFFRRAKKSEIEKGKVDEKSPIVQVNPLDYKKNGFDCYVGIKIESVFINSVLETIRLQATDVIIYKTTGIRRFESIYTPDLDILPVSDDEEDDGGSDIDEDIF